MHAGNRAARFKLFPYLQLAGTLAAAKEMIMFNQNCSKAARELLRAASYSAICISLLPHTAHSQTEIQTKVQTQSDISEALVVTATRSTLVTDAIATTQVISGETLRESGIALTEQLARLAQLDLRANGGPGQTASVFMRGAGGAQILVLIDGVRSGSSTTGATALENIPLAIIERVEIVRGGLSSLYGSDAVGGVIQIFTRNNKRSSADISAQLGSNQRRHVSASGTLNQERYSLAGSVGYENVDAPSATNPSASKFSFNPDRDPYSNKNGSIKFKLTPTQETSVELAATQANAVTHFDGGPDLDDINHRRLGSQRVSFQTGWRENAIRSIFKAQAARAVDDSKIESAFPGQFKTTQSQTNLIFEQGRTLTATTDLEWLVGADSLREKVSGTQAYDQFNRTTNAVFTSARIAASVHQVEAGARHDRESQFGNRNTYNLGYAFSLSPQWRLAARAATTFRVPSFNDLYYPDFSNPALQPERGRSNEISLRHQQKTFNATIVAFASRIENLITFSSQTFLPENIGRSKTNGLEFNAQLQSNVGDFGIQLTSQKPRDEVSGKQLRNRSKTLTALNWAHNIGAFNWRIGVDHKGERFDSTNESAVSRLTAYTLLDFKVGYRINQQWRASIVLNNASNKKYESVKGYDSPRREWLANVSAAF